MFHSGKNQVLNEIVQVVESATKAEQKRMLYLLKVEKTRSLARKLSKGKPARKFTDEQIAGIIHQAPQRVWKKISSSLTLLSPINKLTD
jgi:hypothetical protein